MIDELKGFALEFKLLNGATLDKHNFTLLDSGNYMFEFDTYGYSEITMPTTATGRLEIINLSSDYTYSDIKEVKLIQKMWRENKLRQFPTNLEKYVNHVKEKT